MITTIRLVNIHYLTLLFFVVRIFNINSLNNFQVHNTLLLIIVTMLYIRYPEFLPSYNWKPLPSDQHPPPRPTPTNTFYQNQFQIYTNFIPVRYRNVTPG